MLRLNGKAAASLAALVLGLAGCGGDDDDDDGRAPTGTITSDTARSGGATVEEGKKDGEGKKKDGDKRANNDPAVEADQGTEPVGEFSVTETEYAIDVSERKLLAEGVWSVEITNDGKRTHALNIEGPNGETNSGDIGPGETKTVDTYLVSGKYELHCPIADHADRGMRVTLPVKG